ncbi:hypothetical protein [Alishewanella longhuensis]
MATMQQLKRYWKPWHFSIIAGIFITLTLASIATFLGLQQPVFAVPWRSYPVELLPDQTYQRSMLWQASQKQYPSLAAQLAVLPLQQRSASAEQSLRIFQIPARYEQHFCTGDKVLLQQGQQQSRYWLYCA